MWFGKWERNGGEVGFEYCVGSQGELASRNVVEMVEDRARERGGL